MITPSRKQIVSNFWFLAGKPINQAFEMVEALVLDAPIAAHQATFRAILFVNAMLDKGCAAFYALSNVIGHAKPSVAINYVVL
jgi:hypothetical protein